LQEPRVSGSPAGFVLAKHVTEKGPNLHDIVVRGPEPTGAVPAFKGPLPFGSSSGEDEGPQLPGAIHASLRAPLSDVGIWTFRQGEKKLCKLPCTRWVVPGPGYALVRESPIKGEAEVRVPFPSENPFREGADVNEQLVAPRGSLTGGIVLTSIGAAASAGGVGLIVFGAGNLSGQTPDTGAGLGGTLGGAALATLGLLGLIWGIPAMVSSHDWQVEATPGNQGPVMFHFSPQALELQKGPTKIAVTAGGISGVF
jgi:hypothetical protein